MKKDDYYYEESYFSEDIEDSYITVLRSQGMKIDYNK